MAFDLVNSAMRHLGEIPHEVYVEHEEVFKLLLSDLCNLRWEITNLEKDLIGYSPKDIKKLKVVFQGNYIGMVIDPKQLLKAISEDRAPMNWVNFNQEMINQFGHNCKGGVPIPGINWIKDKKVTFISKGDGAGD